jgi:hypothetical protein
LRASWNDPLTLKLITLTGDSSRPLSIYSPGHARNLTRMTIGTVAFVATMVAQEFNQ